jgi:acyl-CoA synthetase (NDP forming)
MAGLAHGGQEVNTERKVPGDPVAASSVAAMLGARSVALVGASARPGSFGARMLAEAAASPAQPLLYPVNPRYAEIGGRRCWPSLADLPGPVDLVLLAVPDAALEEQLTLAARHGARTAVIFGSAVDASPAAADLANLRPGGGESRGGTLRERLAAIAHAAGMALCGAGCMGFVNVAEGLRAIGYTEPDPLPAGPVALVTHSGSVFSALLRTRRAIGYTLAVSSGQELVTSAAAYLEYALELPQTQVLALVLEAIREPARLRRVLARAAGRGVPVVLLTAGASAAGAALVTAHSGALAAADGGWEALRRAYGLHRVGDLQELTDTLELFTLAQRHRPVHTSAQARLGIATVHDSGLERAHTADLASQLGVPFGQLSPATKTRLAELLDPGLEPDNPLDVWGTGAGTRELLGQALTALAADPSVAAAALAVDLIHELDGDDSYPEAVLDAARQSDTPVAVLASVPSAVDPEVAARLRGAGVPVLEGLRTGLLALRHWLDHQSRPPESIIHARPSPPPTHVESPAAYPASAGRAPGGMADLEGAARCGVPPLAPGRDRWRRGKVLLAGGPVSGAPLLELLREYGIPAARAGPASCVAGALTAAGAIGYPVVLKTDEPAIQHKSDSGGVILNIRDPAGLTAAYRDLSARLGARVLVCETIPAGVELTLGLIRDPALGPLIVIGAGGVLVEVLADRVVALPPVSAAQARELIAELRIAPLLDGFRGGPKASLEAIVRAVTALSTLAAELGDRLTALDINPLICGPVSAVAVDALAIPYS